MAPHSADEAATQPLKIGIVGHVDHGKSTLVGRLFHDTGALPEGKLEAIQAMCERRGMPFEWAFLMDAFQSERDQGITIDTSQIWFKTRKRDYVIIDAPGHREFIKNMITGASSAEAALLLIDAGHGIQQQSRLHGFLLNLLGIRQVAVVVSQLATRLKRQLELVRQREIDMRDLYAFSRRLAVAFDVGGLPALPQACDEARDTSADALRPTKARPRERRGSRRSRSRAQR